MGLFFYTLFMLQVLEFAIIPDIFDYYFWSQNLYLWLFNSKVQAFNQ